MKNNPFILIAWLLCLSIYGHGFDNKPVPNKYKKIQKYLDQATSKKLAGVSIYIRNPKYGGEWMATSGYANIEKKQVLQLDHLFSLASIGKMYNAVAVMKLIEEGRIQLDNKISNYLSSEIIDNLPNAKKITIRHLLGHKSGLFNYENDPELVELYTSGQLKLDTLSHINALRRYVFGKNAICLPGVAYHYSSTNYMLLAMIIDKVVPEGHTVFLRKLISTYGFTNTYYRQTPPHKNVNYYGDLNQDNNAENLTLQTIETTNWFMGDDGVYASIKDAAHFLEDLMNGKILSQQSLQEMKTWNHNKKPDYGLGLMADKSFPYGFLIGHSGRGIGTTTDLYFFPKQNITIAILCNTGMRASAPSFKKIYLRMRTRIVKKLFLF